MSFDSNAMHELQHLARDRYQGGDDVMHQEVYAVMDGDDDIVWER